MNKICNFDNQCGKDQFCTFNDQDMKHYCAEGNQNKLYEGCLDDSYNYNQFENIESHSDEDKNNYRKCVNFARRQVNKDGLHHNHMIFKQKKVSYVDISSIQIFLKCGNKIISSLPLNDYFTMDCDVNNQNCKIKTNKLFRNFVLQNQQICSEQLFLEVHYECYNENMKNKDIIPVNEMESDLALELKCPVQKNKEIYQSKCISLYINPNDLEKINSINKKKLLYKCSRPVYNVPRIIKDNASYKKLKFKNNNMQINSYDENINQKMEELNKLQAMKFQKIKKINYNEDISINDAMENVRKFDFTNLSNTNKKWKLFQGFDAAQYLVDDPTTRDAVKLYGKVYTIEEAMNIASKLNESFFVYYANSYELNNYSSNLYFVDIFSVSNDIFDQKNWSKSENVTTGILNFENFYDQNDTSSDPNQEKLAQIDKYLKKELEYRTVLSNEFINLTGNKLNELNNVEAPIIRNMVSNLDKKNTTKMQAIKMSQNEEQVNNNMINLLSSISLIIFFVLIFFIAYYNSKLALKNM